LAARLGKERLYVGHGNFYAIEIVRRLGLEAEGFVRAGFVHYNTLGEVERLLDAL
jgi:selenocysteine lyase/cysteine desulfurase